MRKPHPSDVTDEQWAMIEPLIPVHTVGGPRTNDMREVLNAIFHQAASRRQCVRPAGRVRVHDVEDLRR